MKMADILRDLADLLDQNQGTDPEQQSAQDNVEPDNTELDPNPVMVPPLQAKLELLKKATGVASQFDQEADAGQTDELDRVKNLAGIRAVVQHEASEDNDVTG
jgi:hypothetical protein